MHQYLHNPSTPSHPAICKHNYSNVPPLLEQLAAKAAGVDVSVIVSVTSSVDVAYTVVAGAQNTFVIVCLLAVTVEMPNAMPLVTVMTGVVVVVTPTVVVPVMVRVGRVETRLTVDVGRSLPVTVTVGWSGARFCRARRS